MKIFDKLLTMLNEWEKQQNAHRQLYKTAIGCYNGFDFDYKYVEERFSDLNKFWGVYALEFAGFNNIQTVDFVYYKFRLYEAKITCKNIPKLEQIAKEIAETVLLKFLRESGDYRNSVDHLVAVKMQANVLGIYYAITPEGVNMLAQINKRTFE